MSVLIPELMLKWCGADSFGGSRTDQVSFVMRFNFVIHAGRTTEEHKEVEKCEQLPLFGNSISYGVVHWNTPLISSLKSFLYSITT